MERQAEVQRLNREESLGQSTSCDLQSAITSAMILVLTLAVIAIVAYARVREGLLTAITHLVNVLLAGLLAFNFFEPIAAELQKAFKGSFLDGYEDALALFAVFAGALGLL